MPSYRAFGLGIRSCLALPELERTDGGDDVVVEIDESVGRRPAVASPGGDHVTVTPDEAILAIQGVGEFVVRGGRSIVIHPSPGASDDLLRLYLVGSVFALLLYQRGLLVLHASAVAIGEGAVAFLGEPGAGKSSLAAELHARGHRVLSDDLTALDVAPDGIRVRPAFPQLKLTPSSWCFLGHQAASLRVLHADEEKRGLPVAAGFQRSPRPLERLYVLGEGDDVRVERFGLRDAVLELVRHSYPSRLLHSGGIEHLRQCADVARRVPVYRLERSRDLRALPEVGQLVAHHAAAWPA